MCLSSEPSSSSQWNARSDELLNNESTFRFILWHRILDDITCTTCPSFNGQVISLGIDWPYLGGLFIHWLWQDLILLGP